MIIFSDLALQETQQLLQATPKASPLCRPPSPCHPPAWGAPTPARPRRVRAGQGRARQGRGLPAGSGPCGDGVAGRLQHGPAVPGGRGGAGPAHPHLLPAGSGAAPPGPHCRGLRAAVPPAPRERRSEAGGGARGWARPVRRSAGAGGSGGQWPAAVSHGRAPPAVLNPPPGGRRRTRGLRCRRGRERLLPPAPPPHGALGTGEAGAA